MDILAKTLLHCSGKLFAKGLCPDSNSGKLREVVKIKNVTLRKVSSKIQNIYIYTFSAICSKKSYCTITGVICIPIYADAIHTRVTIAKINCSSLNMYGK